MNDMSTKNRPANLEQKFTAIEAHVQQLLDTLDRMQQENTFLRKKLSKLTQTRAVLVEKNRNAAEQVKRIISHLREELN